MATIRWATAIPILAFAWTLGAETNDEAVSGGREEQAQSKVILEEGGSLNGITPWEVEQCLSLCDCLGESTVVPDCDESESECPDGFDIRYVDGIKVTSFWQNGVLLIQSKARDGRELSRVSELISAGRFARRECWCETPEARVTINESDENRDGKADHRRTTCSIRGAEMLLEVEEAAGEQEGEWRGRQAYRVSNTRICP